LPAGGARAQVALELDLRGLRPPFDPAATLWAGGDSSGRRGGSRGLAGSVIFRDIDGHSGRPARPWHGPALARSLSSRAVLAHWLSRQPRHVPC